MLNKRGTYCVMGGNCEEPFVELYIAAGVVERRKVASNGDEEGYRDNVHRDNHVDKVQCEQVVVVADDKLDWVGVDCINVATEGRMLLVVMLMQCVVHRGHMHCTVKPIVKELIHNKQRQQLHRNHHQILRNKRTPTPKTPPPLHCVVRKEHCNRLVDGDTPQIVCLEPMLFLFFGAWNAFAFGVEDLWCKGIKRKPSIDHCNQPNQPHPIRNPQVRCVEFNKERLCDVRKVVGHNIEKCFCSGTDQVRCGIVHFCFLYQNMCCLERETKCNGWC